MTHTPDTSRIDALEERIAHQDATIDELNAALTAQWKVIDRLQAHIKTLDERMRESETLAASPAANTPPPHY